MDMNSTCCGTFHQRLRNMPAGSRRPPSEAATDSRSCRQPPASGKGTLVQCPTISRPRKVRPRRPSSDSQASRPAKPKTRQAGSGAPSRGYKKLAPFNPPQKRKGGEPRSPRPSDPGPEPAVTPEGLPILQIGRRPSQPSQPSAGAPSNVRPPAAREAPGGRPARPSAARQGDGRATAPGAAPRRPKAANPGRPDRGRTSPDSRRPDGARTSSDSGRPPRNGPRPERSRPDSSRPPRPERSEQGYQGSRPARDGERPFRGRPDSSRPPRP